jgi:Zonular occludens toxin (Zot).
MRFFLAPLTENLAVMGFLIFYMPKNADLLSNSGLKAMKNGRRVYANFRMKNLGSLERLYTHYNDPLEVLGKVKNALILMSEVGILLDQLNMWEVPYEVWVELRQHRKDGVNIIADAQDISDVAYTFRRLIQFQYHIYAKYRITKNIFITKVRVFNPQPKGDDYGRRFWISDIRLFDYYDTNYKLEKNESLFEIGQRVIHSPLSKRLEMEYLKGLEEVEGFYLQKNRLLSG